jgi:cell division protein FtsW
LGTLYSVCIFGCYSGAFGTVTDMLRGKHADKLLVGTLALLVVVGAAIFISSAFGLLARGASHISSVAFSHLVLGIGLGLITLIVAYCIDYRFWRQWAPHLFGASLIFTCLVFVPQLGITLNGSRSWLDIFGFSFQPAETLKVGIVLISAALFATLRDDIRSWRGPAAFGSILAFPVLILSMQPDIGTLGIIVIAAFSVYIAAGARFRDIALFIVMGVLALGALVMVRPYMLDRITTFINPQENPLQEGYQIRQSFIAIGSGGLFGRGFGQGVQKFTYLPEPMGDSIFAVAAEETGFVGATVIIALFLIFALRGFQVATHTSDMFGALVAVGLSSYLVAEAFINIAAMLGLAPLTGIPLTFFSQGGSAMLISLGAAGILLNISRRSSK